MESPKYDYMQYFFHEINKYANLHESIQMKLEDYSKKELKEMANQVLTISYCFIRYSAEIKELQRVLSSLNFHFAVMWHLSDSLHNIPDSLNKDRTHGDFGLAQYLSEFFVFNYLLENMENKPLNYNQRFQYKLGIKTEWYHLYDSYTENNIINV
ncbi:hypothetical protein [Cytobacillus purgationiresistens]|uniref:Uncharacterized protein n=1 Tax=Cytobacillus purgationiresistens TaxID=863449 RepID=A0ABU0ART6_9BACI|nr:hypothetical protein [Cytobacillus purgationiresistens]MDQ0273486.1 hypothetical protein [Cytobacillus purgationiresistens]